MTHVDEILTTGYPGTGELFALFGILVMVLIIAVLAPWHREIYEEAHMESTHTEEETK